MAKHIIYDPVANIEIVEEIPDDQIIKPPDYVPPPTYEERIAALEKAMLEQLLGGA